MSCEQNMGKVREDGDNEQTWRNVAALMCFEKGTPVVVFEKVGLLAAIAMAEAGHDLEFIGREIRKLAAIYFKLIGNVRDMPAIRQ